MKTHHFNFKRAANELIRIGLEKEETQEK